MFENTKVLFLIIIYFLNSIIKKNNWNFFFGLLIFIFKLIKEIIKETIMLIIYNIVY